MKKRFAGSKALLTVVVLAVVAAMCTVSKAGAAPSGSAAGISYAASLAPVSDSPCNFVPTQTCTSSDPIVTDDVRYYGDTAGCTFVWSVAWGDGDSKTGITMTDPADGYTVLAQHTFAAAGVFSIKVTGKVTAGTCTAIGGTHTFTLTSPLYECSCVLYVRDALAAQGVTLPGGPAYAYQYTTAEMQALGWSHVALPGNGTIPDGDMPMVMVWGTNTHGAFGEGHMAIVVNAWARVHLGATGKSPWYDYSTKRWNITVLQDDWSEDPSLCSPAQHLFNNAYQDWGNLYGINFYVPE
jgi:hypothetical protein